MLDSLAVRPLRRDDVPAWARLLAAAEEVDRSGEHYSEEDLDEELAAPGLDLAVDSLAVLDGDRLVGAIVLDHRRGSAGAGDILNCDGVVHPRDRGRGVGRRLLDAGRARADALGAELHLRVLESNASATALAEAFGMAPQRWWSEMHRDLAEPVVPVVVPAGVEIVALGPGYDAPRWDEPLRAAHNIAFARHWGSSAVDSETWRQQRTAAASFRAEFSAAAVTGEEPVAGYLLAYEHAAATERTGRRDLYVATVGTLPQWRGRGLAAALLTHALTRAAAAGFATSSLTADTQNATGAVGVYERAGFAVAQRSVTYRLTPGA